MFLLFKVVTKDTFKNKPHFSGGFIYLFLIGLFAFSIETYIINFDTHRNNIAV